MVAGFLFENDVKVVACNNFNTAVTAADRIPASASFIDMEGIDHGVFLIHMGTLDTATTLAVYQDTSATETASIKAVTSATQDVLATDDNKWLSIEFNANQLDQADGFHYVTLVSSAGTGSNDYLDVFFLGFKNSKVPVSKATNYAYHVSVVS